MNTATWAVPIEAVRYSATADGSRTLAQLAALHAEFQPHAIVELTPHGWVATVVYSKPGFSPRVHHAHVMLGWAPCESLRAGEAA
jgi:hypothetical protein